MILHNIIYLFIYFHSQSRIILIIWPIYTQTSFICYMSSGNNVRKVIYGSLLLKIKRLLSDNILHIFQLLLTVRVLFKIINHSAQRKFQDGFVHYCCCFSWMIWYMMNWGHIRGRVLFRDLFLINQYSVLCLQIAKLKSITKYNISFFLFTNKWETVVML